MYGIGKFADVFHMFFKHFCKNSLKIIVFHMFFLYSALHAPVDRGTLLTLCRPGNVINFSASVGGCNPAPVYEIPLFNPWF